MLEKSAVEEKRRRKAHFIPDLMLIFELLTYLRGDLVRDDRTLPSHHLGRAWVVGERDKAVQVAHFSVRINLKQMRLKHCLISDESTWTG